jgi:hypothetical protein
MPRLSIYVPDSTWRQALAVADGNPGPSELVQGALSSWLDVHTSRPSYATVEGKLAAERDRVAQQVEARAAEVYRLGYAIGLAVATEMPAAAFASFESSHGDLQALADASEDQEWPLEPAEEGRVYSLRESLARNASEHGLGLSHDLSAGLVRDGVVDAIRDVWQRAAGMGDGSHLPTRPAAKKERS